MKNPMDKFIILLLLLTVLFAFFATVIFSESTINLSARSAVLYEPVTKDFVYEKNADERLSMASTTKIMTALVALENFPCDGEVAIPEQAVGIEGSSLYLKAGECFLMKDLITGLMLRSANDAAVAIAYAVAGSVEGFSDLMNERALSLGLVNTHFENPHGLDSPGHYTTARELAVIAAEALNNDTFKEITSTKKTTITNTDGEVRLVTNHNKLLSMYDGAIGVKTGFTKKSGRSLVGACERDGLTLITVTIDAPDDWNDHKKLFDYGYSHLSVRHLANAGDLCYNIPVLGSDKEYITVKNEKSLDIILKSTDEMPKISISLPRYTAAPVRKGEALGGAIFTQSGRIIGELELIATDDAQKIKHKKLFDFK